MLLINIAHNLCIFFGICFVGNIIVEKFLEDKIWNTFQEKFCFGFIIGFILISFLLYVITLFNFFIIELSIFINLILIIFSIIFISKKKIDIKISFNSYNYLLLLIILTLFISTLLPITDADTIAYHLEIPQKIIENKRLSFNYIDYHEIFYGPGEAIYLLGTIFKNYNLPQFFNFIALIILFLIVESLFKFKNYIGKSFLIFGIMSSPVLFQLFLSGKPQLIFISINIFLFSMLHNFSKKKIYYNKNLFIFFVILIFISLTIVLAKITFIFTSFAIFLYFLFIYKEIFKFKSFYIIILLSFIICLIIFNQKYSIYGAQSLYFIPSILFDFDSNFTNFLEKIKLSNNYKFFPLNLFIPLSKNTLLDTLGYISIFFVFLFLYFKNDDTKERILIFLLVFILILFGLKHSRFFIEPIFIVFCILISNKKFEKFYNKNFRKFKIIIIPQLVYMSLFICYIFFLNFNLLSKDLQISYLKANAFGYEISNFLNQKIKNKSKIIINYRSLFYSKHEMHYMESSKFGSLNYLSKKSILNISPQYIVIVGKKNKLQDCLGSTKFDQKLRVNASRNPLKKIDKNIDVSVYEFTQQKLKCF